MRVRMSVAVVEDAAAVEGDDVEPGLVGAERCGSPERRPESVRAFCAAIVAN